MMYSIQGANTFYVSSFFLLMGKAKPHKHKTCTYVFILFNTHIRYLYTTHEHDPNKNNNKLNIQVRKLYYNTAMNKPCLTIQEMDVKSIHLTMRFRIVYSHYTVIIVVI